MTLLITILAAIVVTLLWYYKEGNKKSKLTGLCLMYWGAALMWLVDSIYEYMEMGADFFVPVSHKIVDDSVLGLLVVALGLVIWAVYQRIISFSAVARKHIICYNKSVIYKGQDNLKL